MQEIKSAVKDNIQAKALNQHFTDLRLTPHISYSPGFGNINPDLFTLIHQHQPFILPKPNFYSPFPSLDETFTPTDKLMQMFIENNNFNPQYVYNT